tara:strand:+ start:124 stop:1152 length:1029 start_codon:yes stop_codon:yes gene_type:complete
MTQLLRWSNPWVSRLQKEERSGLKGLLAPTGARVFHKPKAYSYSKEKVESAVTDFPGIYKTFLVRGSEQRPYGMVSRKHYGIVPAGSGAIKVASILPVESKAKLLNANKAIEFTRLKATWDNTVRPQLGVNVFDDGTPNADGEFTTGVFTLDMSAQSLPFIINDITEVSEEELASFDVRLYSNDELSPYTAKESVYFNRYEISDTFIDDFVYSDEGAGGFFCEKHATSPHWFTPLSESAGGFLVFGREIGNNLYDFAAFKVPYGYTAFATGIHADQHAKGPWTMAFSPDESLVKTVFWRNRTGNMVRIEAKEHYQQDEVSTAPKEVHAESESPKTKSIQLRA